MTDADALLRAILHAPADDAPRLALADWLEDNGQPERAEFTRVQLDLARDFPGMYAPCVCTAAEDKFHCDNCLDTERAGPLLGREWAVRKRVVPGKDVLTFEALWDLPLMMAVGKGYGRMCLRYRRGWVDRVEMPAGTFMAHAAALFALHPVTDVRLTNREPYDPFTGAGTWNWYDGPQMVTAVHPPSNLPTELFALVKRPKGRGPHDGERKEFATHADAIAALSRACVAHGRNLAGLPALKEEPK